MNNATNRVIKSRIERLEEENKSLREANERMKEALEDMVNIFPIAPTEDDGTGRRGFGDKTKNAYTKAKQALQANPNK